MNISVDSSRCIGCGMCVFAAPEVFRLEGRVSAVWKKPEPPYWRVTDAANGCPVNAIAIERKRG